MNKTNDSLPKMVARGCVRSLNRGTVLPEAAPYLNVGHDRWIKAQIDLLEELAEVPIDYDIPNSDTKFVKGAYGSGKSHFLSVIQSKARELGWATAHLECQADGAEIDRFETP